MTPNECVLGIISPSAENRAQLCSQLKAAHFVCRPIEAEQYCPDPESRTAQLLAKAEPDIVVVDMAARETALSTLRVLHELLPETWLFVSSASDDPQLIIESMRSGAREYLSSPVTAAGLSEALSRYSAEKSRTLSKNPSGKLYSVISAKGGAGTTSVALNLAVATAAVPGVNVALLDLGTPVGDVTEFLNLKSKFTVGDVLGSASRLDSVLLESYMSHAHGVAVLPGQREFQPGLMSADALARVFQVFSETYSHAFCDLACLQDEEQMQVAVHHSSAVLVILTPELPALWRTERLMRRFEKIGGSEKLLIIVNRWSKQREIGEKEIEKTLGRPVYWNLPNNYPAAIQAVNSGKPLVSLNHSSLASSYFELSQQLTGLSLGRKKRGIFGLGL